LWIADIEDWLSIDAGLAAGANPQSEIRNPQF